MQLHVQRKLRKNLNPNRGSCSTYARIQYSKLTFLALFAVKARRQKWKYNFGLILPVIRVCLHEMQLCMKPYVRGLLLNKRPRMSSALWHTTHNPYHWYHQVFSTRWRQCLESKAKWNLHTSMIATIIGTVLDRIISNINMKELLRMAFLRRSYSIMNAGMVDLASCRYDVRRIRHSSSLHISIAYSIVYITI